MSGHENTTNANMIYDKEITFYVCLALTEQNLNIEVSRKNNLKYKSQGLIQDFMFTSSENKSSTIHISTQLDTLITNIVKDHKSIQYSLQ